jgi:hypothetical protein
MENSKIDNQVFKALYEIYSNPSNKDRYGQVPAFEFREGILKGLLDSDAIEFIRMNKSEYGSFYQYSGRAGSYYAFCVNSNFYDKLRIIKSK